VVGVDYSRKNVEAANQEAKANDLCGKVVVQWADAEQLPFPDASFDAVICECALCTFPDKQAAIREFHRVLRPHGQVGISDLTRNGPLAPELSNLMSWIACIADAQSLSDYAALLSSAAFATCVTEQQNGALFEFVSQMRTRLLAAEVMVGLRKLPLPGFDFEAAKSVARHALEAVKKGNLGYAIIVASKMA
jgi:ubiquinone/menaquinone biosynthesis C-methylase UbiE